MVTGVQTCALPILVVMHRGRLHAHGAMAEVLTAEMIDEVFEVTAHVEVDDRRRVNWSRR